MNSSTLESKKVPGSRPHRQGGQYGSPKGSPTPCHRPAQALYTPGAFSKQKKNTDSQAKQTATAADSPETFLTQGSVPKLFIETEIVSKKSEITKLQMVEEVGNLMGYQDLESGLKNNEERNSIPSDDNNLENGVKKVTNISLIDAISVNNELGDNGVKNNSLSDLVTEKSGAVCINSNCGNVTNCLQSSSSLGQVHVNNFDCPPGSVRYKVGNAMSDICEDSCCKDSKIDEIKSNIEQNETNDDCNCFISVPDTIFNAKETEQPESNQALNNVNKNVDNLKLIMNECKENDDSQKKRASLNDNKIQPRNGKGLAAIESERGYEGNQNQKIVNEEGPVKNKGGCRINGGDKIIETQGMLGDEKDKTFQDNNECIGKSKGNERTESTFDDDFFVEEINVTVEIVNKKLQPKSKRQNRKEKKAKKRQENLNEAKTKFKEAAMNEERLMRTEDEARGLGNKKKNNQDIQKKNEEDKQVPHEGGETHDLGEKANNEPKVTKEKTESKGGTVLYLGQKSSSTEGTENVGEENSFDKKGEILHSVKKGKSGKKGKQKNANAIISKGNGAVESGNRGKCSKEAKSGKEKLVSTDDETKSKVLNSEKNGANDQVAKKIKVKVDQKTAGKSTMTKRGELGEQPTTSTGVDDVKMEQSGDRILNQKEESDSSGEDWEKTWTDDGECLSEELLAELTEQIGTSNVEIVKAQFDYLSFKPNNILENGGFDHVLEMFDFSPDFKERDLVNAIPNFQFDIRWVDDTHALAVFSSHSSAQQAIAQCCNPMLKLRPLYQGIQKSKLKASRDPDTLRPHKERPKTTKLVANRLVTGALGIRSKMSKDERRVERDKIEAERDRKLNKEKQKKDLWESDDL